MLKWQFDLIWDSIDNTIMFINYIFVYVNKNGEHILILFPGCIIPIRL